MLIRRPPAIRPSEITGETVYRRRREFLKQAGFVALGTMAGPAGRALAAEGPTGPVLAPVADSPLSTDAAPNSWEDITTYNNFYEFGTGKDDPAERADSLRTRPWSVTVGGECARPGVYQFEDLVRPHRLEERIYRLRCVEAWSMVVPWVGIPMAALLARFEPGSAAKYVKFTTLYDPEQMPGQRRRVLDWPYVEGLTIAEAMHPLTIMTVGLYGRELPNQNGAPLRLVVPWKYGFKSIKSIVRIDFVEERPRTTWEKAAPNEYGFYANVNPEVDHPRWSQASERRIGAGIFAARQPTLKFNGYGDQVADLYRGLDLRRHF